LIFLKRYDGWGKASKNRRISQIYTITYQAKNNSSSIKMRILIDYILVETDLGNHLGQLSKQYGGSLTHIRIAKPQKGLFEEE
jgi:hypothetical protein